MNKKAADFKYAKYEMRNSNKAQAEKYNALTQQDKGINSKIMLLLLCFISPVLADGFNSPAADGQKYSYLYAPGIISIETQLAKYLPSFIASTGEAVTCQTGLHLIDQPVSVCKFAEVRYKPYEGSYNPFSNLAYLRAILENKSLGIIVTLPEKITPTQSVSAQSINIFNMNFGQDADIACLYNTYQAHVTKHPDSRVIAYGASRGAAATFNFVAQYKPENVCALVLEGIFDSIDNLLKAHVGCLRGLANNALDIMTNYVIDGPSPLANVAQMPKNLPILLITSAADKVVPIECTINLYTQLQKAGHKNVHLLILKNSAHPSYTHDDEQDRHDYQAVVHAFYRHYGLPYIQKWATFGEQKLV